MIRSMGKVLTHGQMAANTKVCGKMVGNMVLVSIYRDKGFRERASGIMVKGLNGLSSKNDED